MSLSILFVTAMLFTGASPSSPAFAPYNAGFYPLSDTLDIRSPDDLVEAVLTHNAGLKALRLRSHALDQKTEYVAAFPDPTLMLTGSPMPIHTARGTQILQLRAEQMIPYPGKLRMMREMAELEAQMGFEKVKTQATELILEAQIAFEEVSRVSAQLTNLALFRDRLMRIESLAITRYETGVGTQQSIWKLQLELSNLDQHQIEMERMREMRVAIIERIVQHPIRIGPTKTDLKLSPVEAAFSLRGDIRGLTLASEVAAVGQKLETINRRPDLGVSMAWFSIKESSIPASSDGRDALALGVKVTLPLGRSGDQARRKQAELNGEAVAEQLKSTHATLRILFSDQKERLVGDMSQLNHLDRELLPAAESLLESSIASYSNGKVTFLDLLDAERMHFQILKNRIDLTSRINAGTLMLNRISGHLDSQITF
ncbi:MAG: TolC family protein [Bacteroidetes Order II. Incertae sedis bacterium]|nr:TolC family protein [Bacteroidetes Order II. bacterium]